VQSVAALTNNTSAVDLNDIYLKINRWVNLKSSGANFTQGNQTVSLTYVAGWDTIPAQVLNAITLTVVAGFNTAPKEGILSERIGAYAISLGGAKSGEAGVVGPMPASAEALLSGYSSPIVPR